MNAILPIRKMIPVFLLSLLIALIPGSLFIYYSVLFYAAGIFLMICVLDFILRTSMRKFSGLILAAMFLAGIAALVIVAGIELMNK